jgi:pimeloyl-ACP methyl ester carboxylesterase
LIHGIAASLHDWDDLIPELTAHGHAAYALDLLGHGESPKLDSHAYQIDWLYEHFSKWVRSLHLTEPAIVIGHSLGGHLALEYARRDSIWTRGLVLVNPFYSRSQLNSLIRRPYSRRNLRGLLAGKTPEWLYRAFVDIASVATRSESADRVGLHAHRPRNLQYTQHNRRSHRACSLHLDSHAGRLGRA